MRIATFNVLHGRPVTDPRRPRRPPGDRGNPLVEAVAALGADVLALQELDRFQPRSGDLDQAALAASAMGAADWRYATAYHGRSIPEVGWVRDSHAPDLSVHGPAGPDRSTRLPSQGIALLSRYPVTAWRVRRFAGAPGGMPLRVVGRRGLTMVRDHARVAIAAVLDGPRGPLTVVATHLSFVPVWNLWQLTAFTRWIADLPHPHLLLGDLNIAGPLPRAVLAGGELAAGLSRPGASLEHRWHDLARTATYPAHHPRIQLDRVLAAGIPRSAVRAFEAPETAISDHRPLIVELPD
ncbi:endonuclease/exonuclease/phosphatase family protein [Actinospica sp. MGRD01-02]|uniref:Endonuclease/exonuclease/phosphatase family protein n=1 Tax=Actinospica acidithermotolerans TaxID=2828514 RepID=A0A941ECW6_9ACTN|nr:endonuclease/exonuclease/phosphatase family protein [Actinospica acidithermotolerans]MBR7825529.1 endonuclease/exonuclease/phosphatase family protein [Actinospica acidithermotolerans]